MKTSLTSILLITALSVYSLPASSADTVQEQYWAAAIATSHDADAIRWLQTDDAKFLALYERNIAGTRRGGAVILHDANGHPDWPKLVRPLRTRLPHHGWSTLSIQLPVMKQVVPAAEFARLLDESKKRMAAAVAFLQAKGINRIVVIGYGSGAALATAVLADTQSLAVTALITISPTVLNNKDNHLDTAENIGRINLAVLDIYAARDLDSVSLSAPKRRAAGTQRQEAGPQTTQQPGVPISPVSSHRSTNATFTPPPYRQLLIDGADHSYHGFEALIVKRISSWLKHLNTLPVIARN